MKNNPINLKFIAFILMALGIMAETDAQSVKMEKSSLQFSAGHDIRRVDINNDYGHIQINTHDERSTLVIYTVHVEADERRYALQGLQLIRPQVETVHDTLLRIRTQITDRDQWERLRRHVLNYHVDYRIQMPAQVKLKVEADYATLDINRLDAPLSCEMDYGSLQIGELKAAANVIKGDYMDSVSVGFMRGGKLYTDYSDIRIGFAFNLGINGDYNSIRLNHIKNLKLYGDHNKVEIRRVKNLHAQGDYHELGIGQIYNGHIDGDYLHVLVHRMVNGPYELYLMGNYNDIDIRNERNIPFRLHLEGDFTLAFTKALQFVRNKGGLERITDAYYLDKNAPYFIHGYLENSEVKIMYIMPEKKH